MPKKSDVQRFWDKVDIRDLFECWNWKTTGSRYGTCRFGGKDQRSNRVAWQLAYGEIPSGLCVLHKCDNSLCCNPSHLFLGTQADNVRDMIAKGRARGGIGERNSHAVLGVDQVLIARALYGKGRRIVDIAGLLKSTYNTISHIVHRRSWTHI